jgi:hypothetical protein
MTLAMSGVAPQDAGFASGLVNTGQQVGGAFGIAVLASVAASRSGGATDPAALTTGYHAAFTLAAGLVCAALVVAAIALRGPTAAGDEAAARADPVSARG